MSRGKGLWCLGFTTLPTTIAAYDVETGMPCSGAICLNQAEVTLKALGPDLGSKRESLWPSAG